MKFVGRADTMATFQTQLDAARTTGRGRILTIRGRRQVGKSAAVERFVESAGVPYVFSTGVYRASLQQQLDEFVTAIGESRISLPDAETLFSSTPVSWAETLGALGISARSSPLVVVLDEFPWMTRTDPTLEGVLQSSWDRTLEKLPILIVLIGSDVSMMEELATYGRPLFGRVTQIVVNPLQLGEVAEALPDQSSAQVIDSYLIAGGFPRLVTALAESGLSAEEYAKASLEDPFSPLVSTGRLILDAEFPDAPAASHILSTIGADDSGHPRFSELLPVANDPTEAKTAQTALTRALALLSGPKSLVEKETPAWGSDATRLRRYRVSDPYLRFWFRYVDKYVDLMFRGRSDIPIDHFTRDWSNWRGRSVEPVVRDSILRLAPTDPDFTGVEQVAPWWSRDGQTEIDVVAATASETAVIGTIKWRSTRGVTDRDMLALAKVAGQVPRSSHARLAAICREGERPAGADVLLTADDLVAAWRP